MPDDATLLRRYAETRAEDAFAELVRRHLDGVYSAALRRVGGDTHLAQDVAQLVFVALARKARVVARYPVVTSWLYTVTRNEAANAVRSEQRRKTREHQVQVMQDILAPAEPHADWSRIAPMLDSVIDELNETDRTAVLLRFVDRRGFGEIGAALRLSEDAARMRVERALEKLRTLLARRGVTSTGAALSLLLTSEAALAAPVGLAASVTGSALAAGAVVAGTSVGTVAGLVQFMSTSKIAASGAVLVLIAVIGTTGYQARSAQWEEHALTAERQEIFALARRTEEAERQVKEAVRVRALARRPSTETPRPDETPPPEEEVNGPFGPSPAGSRARGRALMAAYPEIQRLMAEEKREFFSAHYQKLYRELGLSAAQIDAFEQIKISGVSTTIGDLPGIGTATFDAAPVLPEAEKDARLRKLLGERGFQRLEEFDRSPQDSRVAQLASMLYFTDTPLTPEQSARFLNVLVMCNQAGRDQLPAEYWAEVRAQAGAFLSPSQLTALGGLRAQDEYNFARRQNQRLRTASASEAAK